MIWRHLIVILLAIVWGLSTAGAATSKSGDITASLTEASKVMEKGAYSKAIEIIDEALRSGKIQSELAAKALLLRAESNEKLGRTAFALSDYNSALWMQGLSDADRKHAEEGKARVTASLGVVAPKSEAAGSPPPAGGPAQPARTAAASEQQPPPGAAAPAQQPAQQQGGGNGISGFFNNLFGPPFSEQKQPPPPEEPPSTAVAVTAPAPAEQEPPKPQPHAKASKKAATQPVRTAAHVEHDPASTSSTTPSAKKAADSGSYAVQLAAIDEEDKAIAETDRIARKYGSDLGGRTPSLMVVPTADGGTLYKVVLAPYDTRGEGVATCELLKTKGLSCMVIVKK